MKLWLDDVRTPPDGWVHATSVNEAKKHLSTGKVSDASLDHDLGDYAHDGGDGWRLVDWMAEHNIWPTHTISVHSANPVGVKRMLATIDRYGPYNPGPVGIPLRSTSQSE